jgi:hypothetical protein
MARRRNREHVDAGRAVLEAVALEDADLGDRHFGKVFAFNVLPSGCSLRDLLDIGRDGSRRGRSAPLLLGDGLTPT